MFIRVFVGSEGRDEELVDANANQLRPKDEADAAGDEARPAPVECSAIGSTALAALTDLCGRTVLSPAFFLGSDVPGAPNETTQDLNNVPGGDGAAAKSPEQPKPKLCLKSHKMAGLKDLLLSEKLNTHAISLQLTAQSQVQLGGRSKGRDADAKDAKSHDSRTDAASATRPKRSRKD